VNADHWILLLSWGLFGLLHSLMAAPLCKKYVAILLGDKGRYYRLLYSLFAFLSLGAVLAVQFSIKSQEVASFPLLKYLVGLVIGLPGVVLMIISIRKYFFNLSGVKVIVGEDKDPVLELTGIHTYVRHPLYLGTLAMLWSVFLFFPLLNNLIACLAITVYTLIGIRLEERKLLQIFGRQYAEYRRHTPMLIPSFRLR
jgi:protein-S-isoprenylcysteine O-methyltransferase Ste14